MILSSPTLMSKKKSHWAVGWYSLMISAEIFINYVGNLKPPTVLPNSIIYLLYLIEETSSKIYIYQKKPRIVIDVYINKYTEGVNTLYSLCSLNSS